VSEGALSKAFLFVQLAEIQMSYLRPVVYDSGMPQLFSDLVLVLYSISVLVQSQNISQANTYL
jgi:hypothetical protein